MASHRDVTSTMPSQGNASGPDPLALAGAQPLGAPLLLSVPNAAKLLGIGKTLAWDLVNRGKLPSVRLGGRVLVPRPAVERLASSEGLLPSA
jgi:excisionase family DNA binding protein